MKENCYLLNCRLSIVECISLLGKPNWEAADCSEAAAEARREAIQALTELDAFRHGKLQNCDKCPDVLGPTEGP